jgi:acyl-coenzyme A synthetase/AMP-(fatty) acid ligase
MSYQQTYHNSLSDPEEFWGQQAKAIKWFKAPEKVLKPTYNWNSWFQGAELNLSYLCIDRHIEAGYGSQTALIYDSPVTNTIKKISFDDLLYEVGCLAGGLKDIGVQKGDTVLIYMPMIPEAIYAMLACARLGAIHSVVFGGFAPHELSIRIDDCKPKVIITASNGVEIDKIIPYKPFVDEAIKGAEHKPSNVVVFDRKAGVNYDMLSHDLDFEKLVCDSDVHPPVWVDATHPSYILYTSGTTGKPKGVIRDTGGYATALKFSMQNIYDVREGDTFWAASDVGWVVGHSYIVYGPLLNRNTTVIFEGKPVRTPDASTFWRVISEHKVNVMFTAPTAIRAIRKEDPEGLLLKKYDLSNYRLQFLAGERCDISTLNWLHDKIKIPVIDHWWQTETGWPIAANPAGIELLTSKPGSVSKPVCGYDIHILNEDGEQLKANQEGFVAIKLPLPPGNLVGLWNNPERFERSYLEKFPGYYFSGDGGFVDEDGYVFITGRVDDIINVAGHRLSTAEMEEVVSSHPAVAECAVFGVHCELKGEKPMGLIVLQKGQDQYQNQIKKDIILEVRQKIGPIASFKTVEVVKRLPKTRSGKILRNLLKRIVNKEAFQIPSTIDDPKIISEIKKLI